MAEEKNYETSERGRIPSPHLKVDYLLVCNDCGEPLTIHYWVDGDVFIDPCENCPEMGVSI